MINIPDHPTIRNMERTGYPDGHESEYPICPECGQECSVVYKTESGDICGCDICLSECDATEEAACFPEKE